MTVEDVPSQAWAQAGSGQAMVVTDDGFALLRPFPEPPAPVMDTLAVLAVLASADRAAIGELGDVSDLPRPWNPWTCPPDLRRRLWLWCDDVVAWINQQYTWRPASMIPACWPAHPHLLVELPTVAVARYNAGLDPTPDRLEDWQQRTLPAFLQRMNDRLGESSCRTGRHTDWPAAARYDHHISPTAISERHHLFHADTQHRHPIYEGSSSP